MANIYFVNTAITLYGSFTAAVTTTLAVAMTDPNGVTLQVASAASFPTLGSFVIVIDGESMTVTAGQGTVNWTVTRTAKATHAAGAAVIGTAGVAADPTSVVCTVKSPTGVITTPTVVKDNVGNYHSTVTPTIPGSWAYAFAGTGAVVVTQGEQQFNVNKTEVA